MQTKTDNLQLTANVSIHPEYKDKMLLQITATVPGSKKTLSDYVSILLDVSGSMMGIPLKKSLGLIEQIINQLPDDAWVELITFSNEAQKLITWAKKSDFVKKLEETRKKDIIHAYGSTYTLNAFQLISTNDRSQDAHHSIIFITDGLDTTLADKEKAFTTSKSNEAQIKLLAQAQHLTDDQINSRISPESILPHKINSDLNNGKASREDNDYIAFFNLAVENHINDINNFLPAITETLQSLDSYSIISIGVSSAASSFFLDAIEKLSGVAPDHLAAYNTDNDAQEINDIAASVLQKMGPRLPPINLDITVKGQQTFSYPLGALLLGRKVSKTVAIDLPNSDNIEVTINNDERNIHLTVSCPKKAVTTSESPTLDWTLGTLSKELSQSQTGEDRRRIDKLLKQLNQSEIKMAREVKNDTEEFLKQSAGGEEKKDEEYTNDMRRSVLAKIYRLREHQMINSQTTESSLIPVWTNMMGSALKPSQIEKKPMTNPQNDEKELVSLLSEKGQQKNSFTFFSKTPTSLKKAPEEQQINTDLPSLGNTHPGE